MNTANLIRTARLANGLTQEALADKVGVHVASVRNWEKGSVPQSNAAARIAEVLGLASLIKRDRDDVDPIEEFDVAELTKALHRKTAELYGVDLDKVEISVRVLR